MPSDRSDPTTLQVSLPASTLAVQLDEHDLPNRLSLSKQESCYDESPS